MKKLLLTVFAALSVYAADAALDTTVVTSHQDVVIKTDPGVGYTLYPQWAEFPGVATSYRKVLLSLKFECAPGLKCGELDYLNHVYLGRKGGVTGPVLDYEIARYITPYGFYWNSAMNWDHNWYFDVTDFASLLHDSVEVIYKHTGYEGNTDRGWKINVKFICIEGTPVREPIAVTKLWSDSYQMGNPANPVENHLVPDTNTLDAQTKAVRLRLINTGHGSDSAEGCMEFCSKYRSVKWDGTEISRKDIWRNDCGYNAVYPQAGTWIYDRAGWCPGSPVRYDDVDIAGVTGGTQHYIDMDMQPYTAYKNFGNLMSTAFMIEYGDPANTIDAELEAILAPSAEKENKRLNPICNSPIIVIKNNGKDALTSATIEYGAVGGTMSTFQWTGNIPFLESDTITLTTPVSWPAGNGKFIATIKNPNGQADQFNDDNSQTSDYTAPEVMPKRIIIYFRSNKDASENYYRVINATTNQVVYDRGNFANETTYQDTLNLTPGDCYYFRFYDDGASTSVTNINKDGLDFWAFTPYEGTGNLQIRNASGVIIKNITGGSSGPYGTKGGDFGAWYNLYFTAEFPLNTPKVGKVTAQVDIYPNPATTNVEVNYTMNSNKGEILLTDLQGRTLHTEAVTATAGISTIDLAGYAPGVYIVKFVSGDETVVRKIVKK